MKKEYFCTKCKTVVPRERLLIINNKGVCPLCIKTLETSKKVIKEVQKEREK